MIFFHLLSVYHVYDNERKGESQGFQRKKSMERVGNCVQVTQVGGTSLLLPPAVFQYKHFSRYMQSLPVHSSWKPLALSSGVTVPPPNLLPSSYLSFSPLPTNYFLPHLSLQHKSYTILSLCFPFSPILQKLPNQLKQPWCVQWLRQMRIHPAFHRYLFIFLRRIR